MGRIFRLVISLLGRFSLTLKVGLLRFVVLTLWICINSHEPQRAIQVYESPPFSLVKSSREKMYDDRLTECNSYLNAYKKAAQVCGAPPLPPFVVYHTEHLPSVFPAETLCTHAAFCLRTGEAPQVPDYIAATCSSVDANSEPQVSETMPGLHCEKPAAAGKSECSLASRNLEGEGHQEDLTTVVSEEGPTASDGLRSFSGNASMAQDKDQLSSPLVSRRTPFVQNRALSAALAFLRHGSSEGWTSAFTDSGESRAACSSGHGKRKEPGCDLVQQQATRDEAGGDTENVTREHRPTKETRKITEGSSFENPMFGPSSVVDTSCNSLNADASHQRAPRRRKGLMPAAMRAKNLEQVSKESVFNVRYKQFHTAFTFGIVRWVNILRACQYIFRCFDVKNIDLAECLWSICCKRPLRCS